MSLPFNVLLGDAAEQLAALADNSVDSIVTDPPYGLGFMGKAWDNEVPAVEIFAECLRVLKPGGHLLAFGGSRTYHRLAVAVEDAGFEIRDQIMWLYGSGFPKSQNVSKAVDKAAGAEREVAGRSGSTRSCMSGDFAGGEYMETAPATEAAKQWEGWGTALKPAHEPIVVARKPPDGTVAANVLGHGTGAINVDGCRIPGVKPQVTQGINRNATSFNVAKTRRTSGDPNEGRWPANVIHDGSDEVLAAFPDAKGQQGRVGPEHGTRDSVNCYGDYGPRQDTPPRIDTSTSAARFFYCAKASKTDRSEAGTVENKHPTVKPLDLMRYLVRLVTPPGGTVLDPFMGSGSTGKAALLEGFRFVGIERDDESHQTAFQRLVMAWTEAQP